MYEKTEEEVDATLRTDILDLATEARPPILERQTPKDRLLLSVTVVADLQHQDPLWDRVYSTVRFWAAFATIKPGNGPLEVGNRQSPSCHLCLGPKSSNLSTICDLISGAS